MFTQEDYPEQWAAMQLDLALLYARAPIVVLDEDRTVEHLQAALQVFSKRRFPHDWALIQYDLGLHLQQRQSNLVEAIAAYREALTVFVREEFPENWQNTTMMLARACFDQEYFEAALAHAQDVISHLEDHLQFIGSSIGRIEEVSKIAEMYEIAAFCLSRQEKHQEALLLLEKGRARVLSDTMEMLDIDISCLTEEERRNLNTWVNTIKKHEADVRRLGMKVRHFNASPRSLLLQQARANLEKYIRALSDKHPELQRKDFGLTSLADKLGKDTGVVVLLVTTRGAIVFIIRPGMQVLTGSDTISLPRLTRNSVVSLLRGSFDGPGWLQVYEAFRSLHDGSERAHWQSISENLMAQIWIDLMKPVSEHLEFHGLQKAVIVPQGVLHLMPLHAAWRMEGGKKRAFIDSFITSYAPSLGALSSCLTRTSGSSLYTDDMLAIVNPSGDLQYAELEGAAVTARFGHVLRWPEGASDKSELMKIASNYSYLHFACHGKLSVDAPWQSAVSVGPNEFLSLDDVLGSMHLARTRLVALSACDTGQIDIHNAPEEYIGLPSGFLETGAAAVLSTLWSVNDLSTMLLIDEFYGAHRAGADPASSLRQAQLRVRDLRAADLVNWLEEMQAISTHEPRLSYEQFSVLWRHFVSLGPEVRPFADPYYWAAFTVTGI